MCEILLYVLWHLTQHRKITLVVHLNTMENKELDMKYHTPCILIMANGYIIFEILQSRDGQMKARMKSSPLMAPRSRFHHSISPK